MKTLNNPVLFVMLLVCGVSFSQMNYDSKSIDSVLSTIKKVEERIAFEKLVLKAISNKETQIKVNRLLGDNYFKISKSDSAQKYYYKAVVTARELNEPVLFADTVIGLMTFEFHSGNPDRMMKLLMEAESKLYFSNKEHRHKAQVIKVMIAQSFLALGDYDKTIHKLKKCINDIEEARLEAFAAAMLANAYSVISKNDLAIISLQKAIKINSEII